MNKKCEHIWGETETTRTLECLLCGISELELKPKEDLIKTLLKDFGDYLPETACERLADKILTEYNPNASK